jgi:hypothetical protein
VRWKARQSSAILLSVPREFSCGWSFAQGAGRFTPFRNQTENTVDFNHIPRESDPMDIRQNDLQDAKPEDPTMTRMVVADDKKLQPSLSSNDLIRESLSTTNR